MSGNYLPIYLKIVTIRSGGENPRTQTKKTMLSRRSGSSSLGQTFEVTDGNYTGAEPSHLKTNYPRGNELGSEARFRDERSFQVMQIECVCDLRLTFLLNINSRCRLLWSSDSMHGFCGLRGKIRPSPSLRESSELSWSGIMSTPSFSSASTARKYLDFYTNILTTKINTTVAQGGKQSSFLNSSCGC